MLQYNSSSLILSMDSMVKQSQKFLDVCRESEDRFVVKSEEMKIMRRIERLSKYSFREFSAAGFFRMNRAVIVTLLGNVITYIIVTTQFNISC